MKILYVITSTQRGGAENALRALALFAKQAGHTVKIISLRPLGCVGEQMKTDGLDVQSLCLRSKFNIFQTAGALLQLIREIENFQPEIVHAFLYRAIQFCRRAKKRVPFRLVTTPHYDLSKKSFWARLIDRGLKELDDVSCAESSQTAAYLMKKQHYSAEKVQLICNGVDINSFVPDQQARVNSRQKFGFSAEQVVFCCVARLSKEKNHLVLLRAFAALYSKNPLVRLILVGGGIEKPVLEAFLAKNGLKKAVLLAGEVSDVRPYLWAADVFVLSSLVESLPLALLEAGACGLPAIVSRAGDMPCVVEHGVTGFVCNGNDPLVFTVLMAELFSNENLRKEMGKNARTRMEQKYPLPEPFYLKIYQTLK